MKIIEEMKTCKMKQVERMQTVWMEGRQWLERRM
jgi:hypothetical protein